MSERLPINYKAGSLPAEEPADRFTEEELRKRRQAFAIRFRELFPGLTDADIARRLGVFNSVVKNYVEGSRFPNADKLFEIQRVTGCNLHWLLTGEGDRRVEKDKIFTEEEEAEILEFAATSRTDFNGAIRKLAVEALKFLKSF